MVCFLFLIWQWISQDTSLENLFQANQPHVSGTPWKLNMETKYHIIEKEILPKSYILGFKLLISRVIWRENGHFNQPHKLMSQAMVSQGSGGAFEVSQRMTALLGWGGTTKFAEDGERFLKVGCQMVDTRFKRWVLDAQFWVPFWVKENDSSEERLLNLCNVLLSCFNSTQGIRTSLQYLFQKNDKL